MTQQRLDCSSSTTLSSLEVSHNKSSFYPSPAYISIRADSPPIPGDMLIKLDIEEEGLKAVGFLAGYETIIFPAEYRGISLRVRGVAIGDPGFLGAESLLTGAHKAALSQVTGEINVLSGLDAVDTLNPGRESFYEESEHYKILRRYLIGEGERVGGYLACSLRYYVVVKSDSALAETISRATLRRRALEDVSAAITQLIARGDHTWQAHCEKCSGPSGLTSTVLLLPRLLNWEFLPVSGVWKLFQLTVCRGWPSSITQHKRLGSILRDLSGNGHSSSLTVS